MGKTKKSSGHQAYTQPNVKREISPSYMEKCLPRSSKKVYKQKCLELPKEKKIFKEPVNKNLKHKDKSLTELTKKFYNKITKVEDLTLSIDEICDELNICRRRAYDLTNILEGLGCLQKGETTKFRWKNLTLREQQKIVKMGKCLKEKSQKAPEYYENEIKRMKEKIQNLYEKNTKYLNFELEDLKSMVEKQIKEEESDEWE